MNEGVFGDIGDSIDDGIRGIKKFFHKAKFKKGDKIMVCMADFTPPGVKHGLEVIDTKYGGWSGGWEYRTGTDDWGNPEWWPEVRVALDTNPDGGYEKYDPEKFPEFKKMEKYIKKPSKESTKKFGKKFTKESASDIAHDPAYQCPYCGSRDCEFDDAEEIGTGLTEGYFDGATFNSQFWCNDCNKPYNVTFELKVKDVYPNEEENLEIELPDSELEDDDL